MNDIYSEIEAKGMNPFFGLMHQDGENHPTLASDLMEEWRAIIVDSVAMSLINGHEIHKEDFAVDPDDQGCYLTKRGMHTFISKLQQKMQTHMKYLPYLDEAVTFRTAISLQLNQLIKAMDNGDFTIYSPIVIR